MSDEKELLEGIEALKMRNYELLEEVRVLRPLAMLAQLIARLEGDGEIFRKELKSANIDLSRAKILYEGARKDANILRVQVIELETERRRGATKSRVM
jgi:hypothetical protein